MRAYYTQMRALYRRFPAPCSSRWTRTEWLASQPDLPVPHLAEAVQIRPKSDELFDHLVVTLLLGIRAHLPGDHA